MKFKILSKNLSRLRCLEGFISGIKGLSITNVADYDIWTIHESNAPFPVTRHQYRMTCDKDILQLSFEDLNQSMSPLKISYHYISSVTVSSSNRHPVCASCMLPRHVLLGRSWPLKSGMIGYPKTMEWNNHFMLHTLPEDSRSQNLFNFSDFPTGECQMVEYICSVTLLQKMSNKVKSHDLPRQGIGPALSTQHCCIAAVVSKVSSSLETTRHEAFIFWYHINKIHQLVVNC